MMRNYYYVWVIFLIVTLLLCSEFDFIQCANVLGFFGLPIRSHQKFFGLIWKELALRGHNVTVVTASPLRESNITNLKEIDLSFSFKHLEEVNVMNEFQNNSSFLTVLKKFAKLFSNIIHEELMHFEVQELIKNINNHFDIVLVEANIPPFYYFAEHYDCPLITLTSLSLSAITSNELGNFHHPYINPDNNLPFGKQMSYLERTISAVYHIFTIYSYHNVFYDVSEKFIKEAFATDANLEEIVKKRLSLVISNVVPELNNVHPKMPNLIEINGLHLTKPATLPKDLKDFLDGANDGAIYFSLGTFASQKVEEKFKIFAEIFSELPYKVVWKMDENNLESVWVSHLKNVFVRSYFESQQDILRHPNVKCFITQGGLHSLEEAIAYQVPIVGLPILGDQFGNVKKMAASGMGIEIDFKKSSKNEMKSAILEVIQNPKYLDRIKQVSKYVFDKPMKPMDEIIWWIEYVIRHKGAYHLRSPLRDLSLYKYLMLDILLPTVAFSILFIFIVYKLFKLLLFRLVIFCLIKFRKSKFD